MFKLSVITDEVSQDLERVARFAKRFKLDGIEIRSLWNKGPHELVERASEIRATLRKYDLEVCCIASPFFKANIDDEKEYAQHIEILKKVIELAKSLDTNLIRGFTFWRKGPLDEYLDRILSKFEEPLDIIKSEGVVLLIENEPSTHVNNGRRLAQFLEALRANCVMGLWDPGNDMFDPEGETPYPEGYEHVRGKIAHIHIKDGKRVERKAVWTPVGEGEVDYIGQLRALKEDDYTGYLSLETHWRPKIELSEEQVSRPGGELFSTMGEEASEICIRNLIRIINELQC